jgi:putative ABC transport system permease protein
MWNPSGEVYSSFVLVVVFLLIVCLNFVNLNTARYMTRAKEVGLRKVVGAQRFQLIKQFLGESILLSLLAFPLAISIFEYICPKFLAFFGNEYDISLWNGPFPLLFFLGVTVLVGITSGSYPAFLLSAFHPASVLKKKFSFDSKSTFARKALVVSQFTLSIIFVVFTIGIRNQFGFLLKHDLGYKRDNVLVVPITENVRSDFESMRKELIRHPSILSVSAATHLPFLWESECRTVPESAIKEETWTMQGYGLDRHFVETFNMQVVQGQNFTKESPHRNHFLLNETAVQRLQWNDPIGKHITVGKRDGTVIGVVKDFHFRKLSRPIGPAVLFQAPEEYAYMFIKTTPGKVPDTQAHIEQVWNAFVPDEPLLLSLLNHEFEEAYGDISKSASVGEIVGTIAVLLSCLGLLGLANFTLQRRTKEVGIRKVVGATTLDIFQTLIREFLFLLLLANAVAWPLSYFALKSLLQSSYAYPVGVKIEYFLLAFILTLFSAVLTVLSQTIKASHANPVDSLRYE